MYEETDFCGAGTRVTLGLKVEALPASIVPDSELFPPASCHDVPMQLANFPRSTVQHPLLPGPSPPAQTQGW